MTITRSVLLITRNVSDKFVEEIKTHVFLFFDIFFHICIAHHDIIKFFYYQLMHKRIVLKRVLTFWHRNYFFLILTHPVYKM